MAWHRQITTSGRQSSSTALLEDTFAGSSSPCLSPPGHDLLVTTCQSSDPSPSSTLETQDSDTRHQLQHQDSLEEPGLELCPRSWYLEAREEGGARGTWRLAFLCLCLPLCYPCYLTRSLRRLRRKHHHKAGHGPERTCLSPSYSQQEKAGDRVRLDAMVLQSEAGFDLVNKLSLQKIGQGQDTAGQTDVVLKEHRAVVHVTFEASICTTSVPNFPVSTTAAFVADLDVLVLAFRQEEELVACLSRSSGVLGYCSTYWRGYYPLLLVKLSTAPPAPLRREALACLEKSFSCCYLLQLGNPFTRKDELLLLETLLQLYLHVFRCPSPPPTNPPSPGTGASRARAPPPAPVTRYSSLEPGAVRATVVSGASRSVSYSPAFLTSKLRPL